LLILAWHSKAAECAGPSIFASLRAVAEFEGIEEEYKSHWTSVLYLVYNETTEPQKR
jgi:hypothetical protein